MLAHAMKGKQANRILLFLSIFQVFYCSNGLVQKWDFKNEDRHQFLIERFGFETGGKMDILFSMVNSPVDVSSVEAAIIMKHEDEVATIKELFQEPFSSHSCLLDNETTKEIITFSKKETWNISRVIGTQGLNPGFYYLYFARCGGRDLEPLSFHMSAKFLNPGPNYLSTGDSSLPAVYYAFSFAFFAAFITWIAILRKYRDQVHHIHHMMAILVLFKFLSVVAEAMRYQYMKANGDTLTNWSIAFYIFGFLKGVMLFVVILLIGTGWSLLKPSLNEKEKKIILAVLCLQVVNNIAFVASEAVSVGTQAWISWRDLLHLVDIICCCAILFPIVWSIRSLRLASTTDGKAYTNLQKLTQFRSFYLTVVCYVYFSRIAVYLLAAALPYKMTWMKEFFSQGASLVFYLVTGWKFMPNAINPYTTVNQHDRETLDEFGLEEDEGVELMQGTRDVRIAI